ncbi:MAG TPA: hypothetical protein VE086_00365, partial [Chthoniobacterales bacterium]|nr:hypothetical protein [Chthoniobacterales bacterium]
RRQPLSSFELLLSAFLRHLGPRFIGLVDRVLSIVGSTRAFVCRWVVDVVVSVVVVQPTSAITQTARTSGINFFMMIALPKPPGFVTPGFTIANLPWL